MGLEQPPSAMSRLQADNIQLLQEVPAHCEYVPSCAAGTLEILGYHAELRSWVSLQVLHTPTATYRSAATGQRMPTPIRPATYCDRAGPNSSHS